MDFFGRNGPFAAGLGRLQGAPFPPSMGPSAAPRGAYPVANVAGHAMG